jgi:hypothetical protein
MAATWTVTGDLPDQYSTVGTSTPILGHVISFITGNGNRGSIFVSNDQYTVAAITPAIQHQANLADDVAALVGKG